MNSENAPILFQYTKGGKCHYTADVEKALSASTCRVSIIGLTDEQARLIAAAPKLFEACIYALESLRPAGNVKKDFSGHLAIATLAKAVHEARNGV